MNVTPHRLKCQRCFYEWVPRKAEVRVCPNPKCHSPYWDRQRGQLKASPDYPASSPPGSAQRPIQPLLDEMVRRIVKECDPEKIILFGSHATGHARPGSDVDLMVVTRRGRTRREQAADLYHCLRGMGVSKDIIVVRPEDVERYRDVYGTIIYPAAHEGKTLYERAA